MIQSRFRPIATTAVVTAWMLVRSAAAVEPPVPTLAIPSVVAPVDIALGSDRALTGRVLDANGNPIAGATVSIHRNGVEIARTQTEAEGHFRTSPIGGGLVEVLISSPTGDQSHVLVRSWPQGTAPPSARSSMLLVAQQNVLRAQYGVGPLGRFATNPWLTAAAITTAIGVPIAVTRDDAS